MIFERAQFNRRKHAPSETANDFIIAFFKFSEICEYGELRDQFIRDRLVVGIADATLSERLQIDKDLTLERPLQLLSRQSKYKVNRTSYVTSKDWDTAAQ